MTWRHVWRTTLSLALTGCLCSIGVSCSQAPGDEFRTYAETIADTPSVEDFADAESVTIRSGVSEPEPENAPVVIGDEFAQVEDANAIVTPGAEAVDPGALAIVNTPAGEETLSAIVPREIELLVPDNSFRAVGPEAALRVSYNDIDLLKVLNMDPVPETAPDYFPDWLNGLVGQRIRIRGFMFPTFIETGVRSFVLARDNEICCFGRNPMPYDIVPVSMRASETTDYIEGRPFDVVGVFNIIVEMETPTKVITLYYIDDAIVID